MELSTLRSTADDGAVLVVTHPVTGEDLDIEITLAGADSERYLSCQRMLQNRRLDRGARRPGKPAFTAEQFDADAVALLAAATISWKNVVIDKVVLPCTNENAQRVYREYPWIRDQAEAFIQDRSRFFGS